MASVFRRPKTRFWAAGWYDAQGRFHLRSTKQTDRGKALAVALEYERAERMARDHRLTEITARRVLCDILERTGSGQHLRMPSVREWLDEWLADKEENASDDTAARYRSVKKSFLTFLRDQADRPLIALTGQHLQNYVTAYRKSGATGKTAQLHLATLHTAFDKARRLGLIESNPTEPVEINGKEGESVEREVFTPTEVAMLVKAAPEEWKTLILLGYYTGARLTTCAGIKWSDIDLLSSKIRIKRPGKRGKPVQIPIHPELVEHLERLASRDTPEEYLLPKLSSKDSGGKRGLSLDFKRLARSAGVDLREVTRGNGRTFCKRTFHALRHSFISALANADVAPELRRKLTGHKSAAAHDVYTHVEFEPLRRAIEKLSRLPTLN